MGATRQSLDGEHFDVAVVGGGINGVAIARECARAGRRTLLVEQRDFASGTTSRSTRIIHGGLRYLEHGEVALVRESVRERQRLLADRRHLVHPLRFVLALPRKGASGRSALEIRLGLWLYRRFANGSSLTAGTGAQNALERLLDQEQQWAMFEYEDAQCEFPERLVAEWLTEALEAGAVARNHTEAVEIEVRDGNVQALVLRDRLTNAEARVSAGFVINAAGPWVDSLCERARLRRAAPLVGGVRGSHLVLDRFPGASDTAVYSEAPDGRPIFMVPWNRQWLLGTTEERDNGDPADAVPSEAEAQYLLESAQKVFPRAHIGWEHVRCAFAGVRPLPYAPDKPPASVSRRHVLHDHKDDGAAGLISVVGGKLTTAASLARECARMIGIEAPELAELPLAIATCDGIECSLNEWAQSVAAQGGLTAASVRAIAEWHGRCALNIASMARQHEDWRQPLCPHTEHVVAEAVAAARNECAVTLGDLLLRRVPVALGACWSAECSRVASSRIAEALGWDQRETGRQLEAFEQERAAFLRQPTPPVGAGSAPSQDAA